MATDAKRRARIELTADAGGLDRGLADASRKMRRFGRDVDKATKTSSRKGGKSGLIGAGILGGATALAGQGIVSALTDAAGETRSFEQNLVRLQQASGRSTAQMSRMRAAINQVSKDTGVARGDILEGTQTYVDLTGDVQGAEDALRTFGRTSAATGASMSDVSTAGAAFREAGVAGKDMEGVFSGLISQGKAGAVGFKDFARELSSVLPKWAQFNEGTSEKGIAQMGASFQIARKGFGTASEAATGLEALMGSIITHSKQIKKHLGVDVFGKGGKLKTFDQVINAINTSKKAGTKNIATAFGGNKEALQTLDMLRKAKNESDGVTNAYEKMVSAGMDRNAVEQDFNTYMQSSSGKLEQSINNIKVALAEAFTPERIKRMVDLIERFAHGIGAVVSRIEEMRQGLGEAFGENVTNNPFRDAKADQSSSGVASALGLGGTLGFAGGSIDAARRNQQQLNANTPAGAAARMRSANYQSYEAEVAQLSKLHESSPNEAKLKAAIASRGLAGDQQAQAFKEGRQGSELAASRYLENQGVSKEEADKLYRSSLPNQGLQRHTYVTVDELKTALKDVKIEVKLDSSTVAKKIDNAPSQRQPGAR